MMTMAQHPDLKVVKEGVETVEKLNYSATKDCSANPGDYFCKQFITEDLSNLLKY